MLAHVPSLGRSPRGSLDSLTRPVLRACQRRGPGTLVPRCLGVAHFAWSPKAALALGCSPTTRLQVTFGRVTCMARAGSVPGLWTLGCVIRCVLLFCCASPSVWILQLSPLSWLGTVPHLHGLGFSPSSCHSWTEAAARVLGYGFCLYPTFPGWGS